MTLVNMKSSGNYQGDSILTSDAPEYPYGLCLVLDNEAVEKLGLPSMPMVGETMTMHAKVVVKMVSLNDSTEGGRQRRVELQVTDMELGAYKEEDNRSAHKVLYEMEDM